LRPQDAMKEIALVQKCGRMYSLIWVLVIVEQFHGCYAPSFYRDVQLFLTEKLRGVHFRQIHLPWNCLVRRLRGIFRKATLREWLRWSGNWVVRKSAEGFHDYRR
jgi:hypothetical protein